MDKIIVKENEKNSRLDSYLAKKINLSRTNIQKLIENGDILVNGKKQKLSYKIQLEDEILINIPEAKDIKLEIIYEDDDIIVVNKPKGMVVHPAIRKSRWNACKCNNEYL